MQQQTNDIIEIWKDVEGYEGLYWVSSLGNIKSLKKVLKLNKVQKGYLHVTLYKNSTPKTFKAHRLIAKAFIPNIENKPEVNHIDGNKENNNIVNLEWNTRAENNMHAVKNGLLKFKKGEGNFWYNKKRGESCRKKLVIDLETGIFYDCAKDASDAKNFTYNQLKNRLNGITYNNTSLRYI